MTDAKFFATTKKGEIAELRDELNHPDKARKKDAVKKVIAAMTVGKDVSMLLADVTKNGQTENLELKKLVYLYLINYAKSQPDLAILAVNTFVKDSQDPNPLIRALAVRTMGCIRVDKITEYLCDPLQKTLKDEDPYVRKTAAICVAKLYDINPDLVEERGFLDTLRELIGDSNPMVVANAVAALAEIADSSGRPDVFQVTSTTLLKLLAALNECTEWGQVFILDALAGYVPKDPRDAESIAERVTPRLQHANCAVVLSAVKVLLKQLDHLQNPEAVKALKKKMSPPLVTLLSAEPEIQYVALRNINLVIQKHPDILANDVKVFFCKYNDPIYVKMEKLEIMVKLVSEKNVDQVLLEFKEYATEVDVEIVRKSVRCIGRSAISLEAAAEKCISVLLELIQTKVNYVVQEAIIVIRDIFRRYPNQYESIIGTLCENLDTLDEPEAKASMIWIVGEYAERIDNAEELLQMFLETFGEEPSVVQLQLITATVKLFLKKPTAGPQGMIQSVLQKATNETDNPDLRDRAFIYWRLLSTDPEAAKSVVLAERPVISDDSNVMDPSLLDELLGQLATLASVYHKPADAFVSRTRVAGQGTGLGEGLGDDEDAPAYDASDILGVSGSSGNVAAQAAPAAGGDLLGDLMGSAPPPPAAKPAGDLLGDLMGLDIGGGAPAAAAPAADPFGLGGLGGGAAPAAAAPAAKPLPVLLAAQQAGGLEISGRVELQGGQPAYRFVFTNRGPVPLGNFMFQFNKNTWSLAPGPFQAPAVPPGGSATAFLPLAFSGASSAPAPPSAALQVAVKSPNSNPQVFYFQDNLDLKGLFLPSGNVGAQQFPQLWMGIPDGTEQVHMAQGATIRDVQQLTAKLQASNVFFQAQRPLDASRTAVYASALLPPGVQLLVEFSCALGFPGVRIAVKSPQPAVAQLALQALEELLY